jgi:uncharacterized protein (TIGR02246 family)
MTSADIRSDVLACNKHFMDAFGRGDAAGLANLYTVGGQLLPPNSEVVAGREAIRAFWKGAITSGLKDATLDTVEVEATGETAVEVGRYTLRGTGGQVADAGKYVVVWKTESGGWKLHRDIWNTNHPAPSAPSK